MIAIRRIDHVCLRVADRHQAAIRWALQFGLTPAGGDAARSLLRCGYEPYSFELVEGEPGHDHTGFELRRGCDLATAARHLDALGVAHELRDGALHLADPEGNGIELVASRDGTPRPDVARTTAELPGFRPRKLGHVNCLTGRIADQTAFYTEVLGMRVSDRLGSAGIWFHVNPDHHVMALVDVGRAHFHHLAFDLVDWGMLRVAFDHVAQHGRWLAWGPVRHGLAQNLCGYVRITEEPLLVELYCDMEQLDVDHEPREWPDDRHSSNTWGPLPPRSYFRFDPEAVRSECESRETAGIPLPPLEVST
ncbi:MAG TPA: VOC family protein [Gaiellales bacterium]|nr:VOC family protein [Gaiellales bacterium]